MCTQYTIIVGDNVNTMLMLMLLQYTIIVGDNVNKHCEHCVHNTQLLLVTMLIECGGIIRLAHTVATCKIAGQIHIHIQVQIHIQIQIQIHMQIQIQIQIHYYWLVHVYTVWQHA